MRRDLENEFGKETQNVDREEMLVHHASGSTSKNLSSQGEFIIDCDNLSDIEN